MANSVLKKRHSQWVQTDQMIDAKNMNERVNHNTWKEKIIAALAIYATAMALVEAVVVVYLRELYYPNGSFIRAATDIRVIPWEILRVEMWRELATMIMLAAVSFLAFDRLKERLWAFVFTFSFWDVGYYLFLYVFLRWPPSLATIDVYFLIPFVWVGPVWFPLLVFGILGSVSFWKLLRSPSYEPRS